MQAWSTGKDDDAELRAERRPSHDDPGGRDRRLVDRPALRSVRHQEAARRHPGGVEADERKHQAA